MWSNFLTAHWELLKFCLVIGAVMTAITKGPLLIVDILKGLGAGIERRRQEKERF